ncbi:hypothetical protein [Endozoicomonas sp. SCSIO W0465]|uniref:hypothetical protein n=1 Tax=Endozoicomonas sp. SCSIO W0465 TaxID=2918516 RepID=UPI00207515B7|nr:hypothetical protein [Endozoicomonas sp. SCSIO W0465]USE33860.1 hypothetical protein MJO57_16950 [Endozoicomonas sp. SCSIO W0465]
MATEPVNNSVSTVAAASVAVANAGTDMVHSSAIKDITDRANAIHITTMAAVDDLGFNKPSFIKWGRWVVGKLGPFGYLVSIVLSPLLIPASLTYDAGRGLKLLLCKITKVEEPVQKLLPMAEKQVEDARKLEQHKQDLESSNAKLSDQLSFWKVYAGQLKGFNHQIADQAQLLGQELTKEQNRNHELNALIEREVRRADNLECENADGRASYQALKVELDQQLVEKSLRIQELTTALEAARQQHDQTIEDNIRASHKQSDKIRSIERQLAEDQQQMRDLEVRYQAEVRTLEEQHQSEMTDLEAQHHRKMEVSEALHQGHLHSVSVQNEEKVQKLLGEISQYQALQENKNTELQSRIDKLEVDNLEIGLHKQQLEHLLDESVDLAEKLHAKHQELLQHHQEENKQLHRYQKEAKAQLVLKSAEIARLTEKLETLEASVAEKDRVIEDQEFIGVNSSVVNSSQNALIEQGSDLSGIQAVKEMAKKEIVEGRCGRDKVEYLESQVEYLESQIMSHEKEKSELLEKNFTLQEELTDLATKNRQLFFANNDLATQKVDIERQLDRQQQDLSEIELRHFEELEELVLLSPENAPVHSRHENTQDVTVKR